MENEILILNKLDILKAELDFIKEYLEDVVLTQDDLDSIADAENDLAEGKTVRLN